MSIFVSTVSYGEFDHDIESCARFVRVPTNEGMTVYCGDEVRYYRRDESSPCTCGALPLRYDGSHILPSDDGPRDGHFDLGEIPGFISHGGRVLCGDDDDCGEPAHVCCRRVWPWLRVSVGESTVLLDYRQVSEVHEYLTGWLERATPPDQPAEPVSTPKGTR